MIVALSSTAQKLPGCQNGLRQPCKVPLFVGKGFCVVKTTLFNSLAMVHVL